jgi:hypothetical protein
MKRLKAIAQSCKFTNSDVDFKHQIIYGCWSDKLRARAMEDEKLTLENLIKLANTTELVDSHLSAINSKKASSELVNQIRQDSFKQNSRNTDNNNVNLSRNNSNLMNKHNKQC